MPIGELACSQDNKYDILRSRRITGVLDCYSTPSSGNHGDKCVSEKKKRRRIGRKIKRMEQEMAEPQESGNPLREEEKNRTNLRLLEAAFLSQETYNNRNGRGRVYHSAHIVY
ncbi:hypothetical protein CEXT_304591 [Caerostris extrusa]|uniref:Uncharacterized protein n=1 Tax=Caerostris extrusa TaxID=172846 RepID=A0AAV4YDI9_CAEEX|nr:hypothetical protein CEXT_304591 [Caerostris extrusa]